MAAWRQRRRDTAMLAARRAEGLQLLGNGRSNAEVALQLGVSRAAVSHWVRRVTVLGPSGVRPISRRGRPPKVARERTSALPRLLVRGPRRFGVASDRWTLAGVVEATAVAWGVRYSRATIYRLLIAQGFRWRRDRVGPSPPSLEHEARGAPAGAAGWSPGPRVLRLLRRGREVDPHGRRPGGAEVTRGRRAPRRGSSSPGRSGRPRPGTSSGSSARSPRRRRTSRT